MSSIATVSQNYIGSYFSLFERRRSAWLLAYLGFYLGTFIEGLDNRIIDLRPSDLAQPLALAAVGSIGTSLWNAFFYGVVWMHLGSVLMGGRPRIAQTVQTVGLAFFPAGLVGLTSIPLVGLALQSPTPMPLVLSALALQAMCSAGALILALLGVRRLNSFSWRRTLVVFAWAPVLYYSALALLS